MKWLACYLLLPALAFGQIGGGAISGGGGKVSPPISALTDTIYVCEQTEMNLFADALIPQPPDVDYFSLYVNASVGNYENRCYRYTPANGTGAAATTWTIAAVDPAWKIKSSDTVVVQVVPDDAGEGNRNVLFIGDSFTANAGYVAEIGDEIDADGGFDRTFIGTQGTSPNEHEGYSGDTWADFNASGSPFWIGGQLDFQQYMTDNHSGAEIDYAVIQLGINDVHGATADGTAMTAAELSAIMAHSDAVVDALLSSTGGYPDCQIIIVPATFGADDWSGIGGGGYSDYIVPLKQAVDDYNQEIIDTYDAGAYAANVDVCLAGLWVDRTHGYAYTNDSVRPFGHDTTGYIWDYAQFTHPDAEGYLLFADAIYSHLRWMVRKGPGLNLFEQSYDFSKSYWTNFNSALTQEATGVTGPWGNTAQRWTTSNGNFNILIRDAATTVDTHNVLSVYIYPESDGLWRLELESQTTDPLGDCTFTYTHSTTSWSRSVSNNISTTQGTGWDAEDQGGGWWRLWIYIGGGADTGENMDAKFWCTTNTTQGGKTFGITEAQVEVDVTSPGNRDREPN